MLVYVATTNAGKLAEMEALFAGAPLRLATFEGYRSPLEGDVSYADNAALKARALRAQLLHAGEHAAVLADDSGLEVRALDGRPGVLTAYYGGADVSWSERRCALIAEVDAAGSPDRAARFVCALHFIAADGRELGAFATVDGEIAREERGELGFSFDPLFFYAPAGGTFAEMTAAQKNAVSHRAIAAAGLLAELRRSGILPQTEPSEARAQ
ncbi:MAG TPA: non-canonical purine NTP pyrophosphatase [Candidatus Baltobacteraceae bacterium]|nr:non-canonical purine NTP pyrophosphatase [Candidatus Baltobacteraceae bacterium]